MKKSTQNLLAPRPNPEIRETVRLIGSKWKELAAEKNHAARKGHAAVMIAHLKSLMDEPETVRGGSLPGVLDSAGTYFAPEAMPEVDRFTEEKPFDRGGEFSGLFFFATDGGMLSRLFTGPAHDPYHVRELWNHGFHVHTMEKLHATAAPTSMHAREAEICPRLLKAEGFKLSGDFRSKYVLFIDPAGCGSKMTYSGLMTARFDDFDLAKKAADFLAECLSVRFLAAARIFTNCTR